MQLMEAQRWMSLVGIKQTKGSKNPVLLRGRKATSAKLLEKRCRENEIWECLALGHSYSLSAMSVTRVPSSSSSASVTE